VIGGLVTLFILFTHTMLLILLYTGILLGGVALALGLGFACVYAAERTERGRRFVEKVTTGASKIGHGIAWVFHTIHSRSCAKVEIERPVVRDESQQVAEI
jgi:hypothetical protein